MPTSTTDKILAILAPHRRIPSSEAQTRKLSEFSSAITDTVDQFVKDGKKIRMVMPAFPQKSPVREKTLGDKPDMAEIISLQHLNDLCEQIKAVYPTGAEIVIYNDGFSFDGVLPPNWTKKKRDHYIEELQRLIQVHGLSNISLIDLSNHHIDLTPYTEAEESFRARIQNPKTSSDYDNLELHRGIKRFFYDELLLDKTRTISKAQAERQASTIGCGLARASAAMSKLISHLEPGVLRLSCHPKSADSEKIGIWFNKDHSPGGSPWHNATVFESKNGKCVASFMKTSEANKQGHRLHADKAGRPSHFVSQDIYRAATKVQAAFFRAHHAVKKDNEKHTVENAMPKNRSTI